VQAAFLNGSDSFREWRGWPPAGSGPLSTMIMSACAASVGARCPPGGVWRDSALSRRVSNDRPARCALLPASGLEIVRQRRPRTSWAPSRPPNVLAVSRRIGREALAQDALKLRFVGSAVLQVMVVAAAGASRVAGRV